LLHISGDVRWKCEPPIFPFEILIALTRRIEKGRISQSLVRKGTEFLDTCSLPRSWKGAFRVKDESRSFLPLLTASRPLLIPLIKPTIEHSDRHLTRSLPIAQTLDSTGQKWRAPLQHPEGSQSQQMRRSASSRRRVTLRPP